MDEEVKQTILNLYNGNIAAAIKKNAQYAWSGAMIGAVAGVLIASFMGKSKLLCALGGAAIGGAAGYIASPTDKKKEY